MIGSTIKKKVFEVIEPARGASRLKYVASAMALVDLVAILPFYLPMFLTTSVLGMRALRLVRLFRILKLNRYSASV